MAKIEKLTKEQEGKLSAYREKWLKIGLSTEPADRARAEAGVKMAYEAAGLPHPRLIIWLDSPMAGAIGAALLSGSVQAGAQVWDQVWAQVRAQVRDQVRDQVGAQVWDQVWDQVGAQVWAQVWDQVGAQVWAQVWDQVRAQVWDQVWDQVRAQVWDQVWDQVGAQVWAQVRDQVWDQVGAQVRAQVRDQVWDQVGAQVGRATYGQHDANWLGFYEFFLNVCEIQATDALRGQMEIAASCGWWWPFANAVILTERPKEVHFDENRRLHNEKGPSVLYRDGTSVFSWHGLSVPDHWISQRESLSPNEVIKNENVELRAAGAAIVGWPKMLDVLKVKVIDDSGSPDIGQLIELRLPGLSEPGRFLKANCPRNGIIVEGVPRTSDIDGLPIETALHAQAWRIGDALSEYQHPPVRT